MGLTRIFPSLEKPLRGVPRLPSLFILAAGVQMMLPLAVVDLASFLAVKPVRVDPYLPILPEASASHQSCKVDVACD